MSCDLNLLRRVYITILENKESFFCFRKHANVVTMAIEVNYPNNFNIMCLNLIVVMFHGKAIL